MCAYRTSWPSVYPGLSKMDPKAVHHLTIDTLRSDTACIASCATNMGIFSLICQKALKETAEYIRANGLTYNESEQLIEWICKRTFTRPAENAVPHHDGGPKTGVRVGVADVGEKPTESREETPGGGRGTGKKGGRRGKEGDGGKSVV